MQLISDVQLQLIELKVTMDGESKGNGGRECIIFPVVMNFFLPQWFLTLRIVNPLRK